MAIEPYVPIVFYLCTYVLGFITNKFKTHRHIRFIHKGTQKDQLKIGELIIFGNVSENKNVSENVSEK